MRRPTTWLVTFACAATLGAAIAIRSLTLLTLLIAFSLFVGALKVTAFLRAIRSLVEEDRVAPELPRPTSSDGPLEYVAPHDPVTEAELDDIAYHLRVEDPQWADQFRI